MNIAQLLRQYETHLDRLQCPLCGKPFSIRQSSLVCDKGHCFDFSRKGYINFVPSHLQEKEKYNDTLFQARRAVFDAGFYLPILNGLKTLLKQLYAEALFSLLDLGCGEGYYARSLAEAFPQATVWGSDISRAAIVNAAQASHRPLWMIADLKRMPFVERGVNVLLDILTPADYTEFQRIASDYLIKVIPGKDYLHEVRQAVGAFLSGGEQYDNQAVITHLYQNMKVLEEQRFHYTMQLSEENSRSFLKMTPMTFSIPEEIVEKIRLEKMTIDMNLYLCQKKS